ncbi:MAG: hypothetical protein SF339_11270 [Blastocatellia bacterium]|nr:hypothetical protein [Blastocatellia bacterium]
MSDHLTAEQIEQLVTRRLAPAMLPVAARHLSVCEACRAHVNRAHQTSARVASLVASLESEADADAPSVGPGLFASLRWAWGWRPLAAAGAFALLLMLLLAGGIGLRRSEPLMQEAAQEAVSPLAAASPAPDFSVALDDHGARVGLDQRGDPTGLPDLSPELARAVRLALVRRQIETPPALAALTADSITLMGEPNAPAAVRLLEPVGVILQDSRPVFRWEPIEGAERYIVSVLDADFNAVATSEPLTQPSWRPERALPRGKRYVWQVTAQVGARQISSASASMPESRFHVLSRSKQEALARRLDQYAQSSLLRGLLYAQAGLFADAEREFRRLAQENPDSPLAQALLREVRSRR